MNLINYFHDEIKNLLEEMSRAGNLPTDLDLSRISVEPPRDPAHGDLSTNAAMVLAKPAGAKPRDLAEMLATALTGHETVEAVDIAGPGFINLWLKTGFWQDRLGDVLEEDVDYGTSDRGAGEKINVEYVSTNPTGLLHVGHARGAVVGDALASLLEKVGYNVTREYYINDQGSQIDQLAHSFILRGRQIQGQKIGEDAFEGLYPGVEVNEGAEATIAEIGTDWLSSDDPAAPSFDIARKRAVEYMMDRIRQDLDRLGVSFEVFSSERALVERGAVDAALKSLEDRGLIYTGTLEPPKGKVLDDWEPRPQTLFRATQFGDDVDRPLKKSDGSWTYFASDIAYHFDKFQRGFRTMIDVWGADHGGYVKRLQAAVKAITEGEGALDVKICQLIRFSDGGKPVRMSKRAGAVITISDVIDKVGRDVVRFIMLTRKNDAPLDFDFAKVTEQSRDNPVFYVQYAHARCCSVFRQAKEAMPDLDTGKSALRGAELRALNDAGELNLIKKLVTWPRIVESAAEAHEPHRLAFYLYDIAADFHAHWTRGNDDPSLRFIVDGNQKLTLSRLALVHANAVVIASGLKIFGVEPAQEMR